MSDAREKYGTTGHEWDGIEEFNNPLPRWWLWIFYATIIWGIGYTIAYPAWPMISKATSGVLGYSTRAEVAEEIAAVETANAAINQRLAETPLTLIAADAELNTYAQSAGAAVFRTYCSQCHGAGAAGAVGYPNLLDDSWLWGGDIEAIHYTISHGIRNEDDPNAHWSEMPAFGAMEILSEQEIEQVVHYVSSLSGGEADPALVTPGQTVYADNCSSCHGDAGLGIVELGAPNIADAIWLYGGDLASLRETVTNARFGVMPPWTERLTEAELAAVAAYVHQLGGGQ
ncbi:MAG: cytochrome-c oxidase, cbb3-type subunit III [Pseudomonadota bacterium]